MFSGLLIRLLDEHVHVRGHVTLERTCGEGANTKLIDIICLIVDTLLPYIIILGQPAINAL